MLAGGRGRLRADRRSSRHGRRVDRAHLPGEGLGLRAGPRLLNPHRPHHRTTAPPHHRHPTARSHRFTPIVETLRRSARGLYEEVDT
ncbi:hypothetical protein FRIGORI9N_130027 [Frigoribacterium sp. 9N]|nr:hypothetical protein FRIGORI9N_130027 [Frigoribacterium sp. 9N]